MIRGARVLIAATMLTVVFSTLLATAYTGTITVTAGSVVYSKTHTIVMNDLVPNACPTTGGNAVSNIQYWNATNGNGAASAGNWVTAFGSGTRSVWLWNEKNTTTGSGGANMNGGGSADCMVPGAVRAGGGTSLQIGGGAGTDVCYAASSGTYTFNSCSTTATAPYTAHAIGSPSFS